MDENRSAKSHASTSLSMTMPEASGIIKSILLILFIGIAVATSAQQKKDGSTSLTMTKKKPPLKYWEEFTAKEKADVIKDSIQSKSINDLYNGKFTWYDAKENVAILNSLSSPSGAIVALRIYLVSKLLVANDTGITKLLNEYSAKIAFNQPDVLLRYFAKEHAKKNDVYKKWTLFLGADLDEKVEYANFKDFMDIYFMNSSAENKTMLTLLYKECEKSGAGTKNPIPIPLPPKGKDD